jgi:hypothetical protein
MPGTARNTDVFCCHDNAQLPISCWQCDEGLLFITSHIKRRCDWLSSWTSICLFSVCLVVYIPLVLCLSHTRRFIYPILSSLYLDTLFHYTRFIPKPLSSLSAHTRVLTDSLDPLRHKCKVKLPCLRHEVTWRSGSSAPGILKLVTTW